LKSAVWGIAVIAVALVIALVLLYAAGLLGNSAVASQWH
jgi:type II secretory pathway component PulK